MGWPGPMTHRQFQTWEQWLDDQWNVPSRSDWYSMQVAAAVERTHAKRPGTVTVEGKKLEFVDTNPDAKGKQAPLNTAADKAKWVARVGGNVTVVKAPRETLPAEI